jgi:putative tryptophan/tyrosine transport system substrate-binding protein
MRRREFITLLGGASLTMRSAIALAEANGWMPKVTVLFTGSADDPESPMIISAFEQGMRAAGWIKGVNVRLDYRSGGTDPQHAASSAAEVGASKPDVVVAIGSPSVVAMARVTTTIPIVFAVVSDPVGQGLVPNLTHPGGNITGFSNLEPGLGGKWLELLKEIAPSVTNVAVMFNPATSPYNELFERSVEDGARTFGVQVSRVPVHDDAEMAAAFERLAGQPDVGLLVPSDAFTYFRSATVVALAAKNQLPAIYPYRRFAEEGGLAAYGVDIFEQQRAAASYVDRILKGAKPGDLPVQMPIKYSLIINLKTAKTLGLNVPSGLLAAADEVVE